MTDLLRQLDGDDFFMPDAPPLFNPSSSSSDNLPLPDETFGATPSLPLLASAGPKDENTIQAARLAG
jgi:hypothetical protein